MFVEQARERANGPVLFASISYPFFAHSDNEGKEEGEKRKKTWGNLLDMSSLHCSKPATANADMMKYMASESESDDDELKAWKRKKKNFTMEKKTGSIAERAIVICEKKAEENAPLKFHFDILGNQNFQFKSVDGVDDDDWHVLITWQPTVQPSSDVILIRLSSREHFQIWIDQFKRIQSVISEMGKGLANPLAGLESSLSVLPRLLLSGSRRDSALGESIREKYGSSANVSRHASNSSLHAEFQGQISQQKAVTKAVFDFDVGILYNKDSIPMAMTLLDLLQKEGHQVG